MKLSHSELCQTFRDRATWTHAVIERGLSTRLGILEETITDVNLIEITSRHSEFILTQKYSRREEGSKSGADWLWCIGEPGTWLSLLVQAKIVNPFTGTCRYLDYRNGKQRSLLLAFARRHRLLPTYCVYSHIPEGYTPPPRLVTAFSQIGSVEWACCFVSPKRVRRIIAAGQNKQDDVLAHSIPWMYPFCHASEGDEDRLAPGLARALAAAKVELRDAASFEGVPRAVEHLPDEESHRERFDWQDADPEQLVTSELPTIALRLLRSKVKATEAPVAGVSVISSVPVRAVLQEYKALPMPNKDDFFDPIQEDKDEEAIIRRRRDR